METVYIVAMLPGIYVSRGAQARMIGFRTPVSTSKAKAKTFLKRSDAERWARQLRGEVEEMKLA